MPKNSVDDWSTTAGDNTDVGGINIAENCPASNVNDALREVMAQIADDVPTKTSTDTLTNKTFGDGVNVGSTAPYVDLYETDGASAYATVRIINSADSFKIQTRDSSSTFITDDYFIARDGSGATAHRWLIAGSEVVRIDSNGRVGIGEASPGASLHITSDDPIIRIEDSDTGAYHHLSGNSASGNFFIDFDRGDYNASAELFIRRNGAEIANFSNSGFQLLGSGSRVNTIRDEDDMSSDDPNALATQQSIKAYNDDTTIGINQTWQDMSGSRASDLTQYQNTTGKPIQVSVMYNGDFNSAYFEVSSNGSSWVRVYADSGDAAPVPMTGVVIPDQHYYRSSTTGGTTDPDWFELR